LYCIKAAIDSVLSWCNKSCSCRWQIALNITGWSTLCSQISAPSCMHEGALISPRSWTTREGMGRGDGRAGGEGRGIPLWMKILATALHAGNVIMHKARRYGFTSTLHCFKELLEQADDKLFSGTVCSNHCLHHLLQPDRSMFPMTLRPRGHSFDLPRFKCDLTRKSFVFRSLYGQRQI